MCARFVFRGVEAVHDVEPSRSPIIDTVGNNAIADGMKAGTEFGPMADMEFGNGGEQAMRIIGRKWTQRCRDIKI